MFACKNDTPIAKEIKSPSEWIYNNGVMAKAFPVNDTNIQPTVFTIDSNLSEVSLNFNKGKSTSPFKNSGIIIDHTVYTVATTPSYDGRAVTLGDILVDESEVPNDFFISDMDIERWRYAKGGKSEKRVNKTTGFEYNYSEGAMAFPDSIDKPSRTIITGEGGASPSRFKHVVLTPSGRYRRLTPVELERLNMFPDNHTDGASAMRRAFLMGNALVTGIVERIGLQLLQRIQ